MVGCTDGAVHSSGCRRPRWGAATRGILRLGWFGGPRPLRGATTPRQSRVGWLGGPRPLRGAPTLVFGAYWAAGRGARPTVWLKVL